LASCRAEDLDVRLARHQFPLGVVAGSLALVLHAGTRLRRVAAVLAMSWNWCGVQAGVASYYSVRLWLLRLGLHQLKHALEHDISWQTFVEKVHRFKQQVSLTPLACLAPPAQRSKARYMNVDVLVEWANRSLTLLDRRKAMAAAGLKASSVEKKLGWLRKELLQFVHEEARQARKGERLLGSSEVLESIIGKFKHVAGERGQHGLTGMVLSIGALVGRQAVATVEAAMNEITNHAVWNWCRSHLGPTVQSLRRRISQALYPEQNQTPLLLRSG